MSRFNFNEITREGKADINKIGENFEKLEANALSSDEIDSLIETAKNQAINTAYQNVLSKFAFLTGRKLVNGNSQGILNINYPSGFTKNNSILISFGVRIDDTDGYIYKILKDGNPDAQVALVSDNINIIIKNPSTASHTYDCRLMLIKS